MFKKGIDVSRWQGNIDFQQVVESGIEYVFIKGTEGGDFTDPKFVVNHQTARQAGLHTSIYHYYRALSSTPEQQANNIIQALTQVGFIADKEFLAIDVERSRNEAATPDQMADHLYQLLTLIEQATILQGHLPMIYCSPGVWNSAVAWQKYDFSRYPLWVAHWGAAQPTLPANWQNAGKNWTVWQYSNKGKVAGIEGDVDLDHWQ